MNRSLERVTVSPSEMYELGLTGELQAAEMEVAPFRPLSGSIVNPYYFKYKNRKAINIVADCIDSRPWANNLFSSEGVGEDSPANLEEIGEHSAYFDMLAGPVDRFRDVRSLVKCGVLEKDESGNIRKTEKLDRIPARDVERPSSAFEPVVMFSSPLAPVAILGDLVMRDGGLLAKGCYIYLGFNAVYAVRGMINHRLAQIAYQQYSGN